ncbi:MAG TPA: glycine betaine ABC transporter substrate-binding protein [Candidatus Acidoferrales bacterium]
MNRALALLLTFVLSAGLGCRGQGEAAVIVGSKNFTEQVVLAELIAQELEARGQRVERRVNLGGTLLCHQAVRSGEIHVYVEYTGTALTAVLSLPAQPDREQVRQRVGDEYAKRFGLEVGPPLGFNNTFAIVVRGEDARQRKLKTISDAVPHAGNWRAGFGYEFLERPDGYRGLADTYGLEFGSPPRVMELGLVYRALKENQVDLVAGNSTDGVIELLDLVILEDDRGYFPPYEAVPVVNRAALERFPELRAVLDSLAGSLSDAAMRRLNYAVDGEQRDVRQVVADFRRSRK